MYQPLIKFHPYPAIITQVLCIFVPKRTIPGVNRILLSLAGDGGMGPKSGLDTADEYVNPKQRYDTGYPRRCGYLQDVFPR